MIQRIQTLFLGIVVIVCTLCLFTPVWSAASASKTTQVILTPFFLLENTNGIEKHHGVVYVALVLIAVILTSIFSIVKFKNRVLQMRLGMLNSLLLTVVVVAFYFVIGNAKTILGQDLINEKFNMGFYLPLVAIVFNMLANRFIKKDEDLVRSVDRIR
jgi:hypothetical protein